MIAALAALNPDEMSPREAIEALYALKAKAADKKSVDYTGNPLRLASQHQQAPADRYRKRKAKAPRSAERHDGRDAA